MDIKLEKLNGHSKSGIVGKLNIEKGKVVEEGQILMQIESKKGNTPVKSLSSGKVIDICVQEGQEVSIGDLLIKLEGEAIEKETVEKAAPKPSFDYLGSMIKGKKENIEADVTVIGGGPGGYVAAIYAAKKGLKVILIEKENLGGTCLNVGCIPTKSLVKSAEVYHHLTHAEDFGLSCENARVNMEKVIKRKDQIKETLVGGIDYLLQANNIEHIRGTGKFIDEKTVFVQSGRDEITIQSKDIIIATGSKISKINIPGMDLPCILNSTTALELKELPKSMTIIGGGVIGMEFAFIYAQFGVKVKVVEYMPRVLTMVEEEISEEITRSAKEKGIDIYTHSKVKKVEMTEGKEAIVVFEKDGAEKYIVSEKVLVAIGREPNIEGLDLEKAGVQLLENGRGIKTDEYLQTNIEHIYAIGDVNNRIQLAHAASHQGMIVVDQILGEKKTFSSQNVPNVIFTSPEIASVGLSEAQAKEKGIDIKVSKFPFAANGKALTMGEDKGFIKMIKDVQTNKVIGASIIGVDASTLISSLTLIIQNGLEEEQIIETIFAHPTTGEVIHECTLGLGIGALHFHE